MQVNLRNYIQVNGQKKPGGMGFWWFASDTKFDFSTKYYSFSGRYSEARKAALNWAKKNGLTSVCLLG